MKNTTWTRVESGQIVSFLYRSKNSTKTEKRTVLCIDPSYTYRKKSTGRNVKLFVGIQLETTLRGPINSAKLDKVIRLLGGVRSEDGAVEVGNFSDRMSDTDTENILEKVIGLRKFIQKNDVFRTYFLRECRKRRVFLVDDYQRLPKKHTDKLILEQNLEKLTDEN